MKGYLLTALIVVFFSCQIDNRIQDSSRERVLVAVEKGTSSIGFYTEMGDRIHTVKVDTFPHEMAFSNDQRYAYVTNNGSLRYVDEVEGGKSVSIVDLQLMEIVGEIPLSPYQRPHGIWLDASSGIMAVSVENPDKILLIDPRKKKIINEFDNHGDTPHMVALSPGAKQIYVTNVLSDNLVVIDTKTGDYHKVQVGQKPQGIAFFGKHERLFVGCANSISVVDLGSYTEMHRIPIGSNRLMLTRRDSLLMVSIPSNLQEYGVGFIDPATFEILYRIKLPYKPFSLQVSSDEKFAYVSAEEQNIIYIISIDDKKIVRKFKTPPGTRPDPVKDFWIKKDKIPLFDDKEISDLPSFDRKSIDDSFGSGYQIKTADLNLDGLLDLMAVSDRMPEIYWYENPSWQKHLISDQTIRNIDLAPHDIDQDGDLDLAIASKFDLHKSNEGGYIHWLENTGEFQKKWPLYYIDSVVTSHRIRWVDVFGNGNKVLVNLPIVGRGAVAPNYSTGASFVCYEIPKEPKTSTWKRTIIDTSLHMAHGISILRWDNDTKEDILTASFEGATLYTSSSFDGNISFEKIHLVSGDANPRPAQGASEVDKGFMGGKQSPFLVTIEPWHGNKVVTYNLDLPNQWNRQVIDNTFKDGHALKCFDLNYDSFDEIIAGHRKGSQSIYIYQYKPKNKIWQRTVLDNGGMSAAGICIFDYNNDGFPDIAACGSLSANIVIYENQQKI